MIEVPVTVNGVFHTRPWGCYQELIGKAFPRTALEAVGASGGKAVAFGSIMGIMQSLEYGTKIRVRATGEDEALAAHLTKTFLEHLDLIDGLHHLGDSSLMLDFLACIVDLHAVEISSERRAALQAIYGKPRLINAAAEWIEPVFPGALLHEWVLGLVTDIARYYQTPLGLSWQQGSQRRDFIFSQPLSRDEMSQCLAQSPAIGDPVVVRTWGAVAETCAKAVAAVLRRIPHVALWLKDQDSNLPRDTLIGRLLSALDTIPTVTLEKLLGPPGQGLLAADHILFLDTGGSLEQDLTTICEHHSRNTGSKAESLLTGIRDYMARGAVVWSPDLAGLHVDADGATDISCTLAVCQKGMAWPGGATVHAILLIVTSESRRANSRYINFLANIGNILNDDTFRASLWCASWPAEIANRLRIREIEIGQPRPAHTRVRVLLVESMADEATLVRDRFIIEHPCRESVHTQFLYASAAQPGERLQLDVAQFQSALDQRIARVRPDYVLVHTGVVYHAFRNEYHATVRLLRTKYPAVRFGYQEQAGLTVDSGIFSDDPDTEAFQRWFFQHSHGVFC